MVVQAIAIAAGIIAIGTFVWKAWLFVRKKARAKDGGPDVLALLTVMMFLTFVGVVLSAIGVLSR